MPIPGDNGNPKAEKAKQEARIKEVAEDSTEVKSELRFEKPSKTEFGNIK